MMIEISTTVDSLEQAKKLVLLDIDTLYVGEENFALHLPRQFSRDELRELVQLAHAHNKKLRVAVNAIMHPEKMEKIPEFLTFLSQIGVDDITVGDPGVIYVLKKGEYNLPYIYDAQTMVTSSKQINFWSKRGAKGAILAREIPYLELQEIARNTEIFSEILVYGANCIHQSKRPLITNYYSYTKQSKETGKAADLFISEPKKEKTHYSIYEDTHGTHIFSNNDVGLMAELGELYNAGLRHWKLNGMYTPTDSYLSIVEAFSEAKKLIELKQWNQKGIERLSDKVAMNHPRTRGLDTGFYYLDPKEIR